MFFGDGAVQGGIFVESVNLATLWALPVILVCENNGFAEFTPRSAHTNIERVSDVVAPYGLARETVDGNDVLAVGKTFARFLTAARRGEGPMLLECLTHRLRGHYEGDPQLYRDALAARQLGGDQVAVVFFGDGAVQGGIFVESVNLATLWRLPVILVCENNGLDRKSTV